MLFVSSEVMLFVGLFTGYIVLRFGSDHFLGMPSIPWQVPLINTGVLVASSLVLLFAARAFAGGRTVRFRFAAVMTLLLGAAFLALQVHEWNRLSDGGVIAGANVYSGMFYVLSGVHGAHVLGGLGVLAWLVWRALRYGAVDANDAAIGVAGIYWHFVTVVWTTVFVMVFVVR